jgi:hypothetical protein
MEDLERVLQQLHDSEINAGLQTFFDTGMRVWIGDAINGIQAETTINRAGAFAAPPAAGKNHGGELAAAPVPRQPRATAVNRQARVPNRLRVGSQIPATACDFGN